MNDRPLREPTFLILTALAQGPQHGYGIMTDVERMSDGRVRLRPWTGSSRTAWSKPTGKRW